jgi:hypothetical protein
MAYEYREYPRILYKDGASVIVKSDEEKAAKLADGWSLSETAPLTPEPPAVPDDPVPPRRGRKPKADGR